MDMQDQVEGFEREFAALERSFRDDAEAVNVGAIALGMTAEEIRRALDVLWREYETAWLMLRIEWGLE